MVLFYFYFVVVVVVHDVRALSVIQIGFCQCAVHVFVNAYRLSTAAGSLA